MEIRLEGTLWIINDGEYIIGEGESTAYVVSDYDGETVYSNDDFECCLTWVWNSIQVAGTTVGADLICKNTDGKDFRWIKYNQNTDTVTLVGNTDQCNLWFGETRPDLTPERIIEFVKDLNEAFEMETPYKLRDLIDGEDWQEIANISDASEDARWRKNQI